MPTYCYETVDGEMVERFFHRADKRPAAITLEDGRRARRSLVAEHAKGRPVRHGKWPRKCTAMGVHPNQVDEAMRRDPEAKFDRKTGECIFDNPQHERRVLKNAGFVNMNDYR